MAPADDTKAAAAEPIPSAPAAPMEDTTASPAPTRSPSTRKAKTATAMKETPIEEAPKAKKPRAKKAPAVNHAGDSGQSYFELIVDAIKELKDRNGSSRQAIGKIVVKKKDNYASHHLNKALRTAADAGKLIQVKGSYKLSPELRKPAASNKKSLKVSEASAKTVKRVGSVSTKAPKAKKTAAKKVAASKKVAAKMAPAKKAATKRASTMKAVSKKAPAEKAGGKKATAKTTKKTVKKTAKK